jgi:hypothetical protein
MNVSKSFLIVLNSVKECDVFSVTTSLTFREKVQYQWCSVHIAFRHSACIAKNRGITVVNARWIELTMIFKIGLQKAVPKNVPPVTSSSRKMEILVTI